MTNIELIRAITRPLLLFGMGVGTFYIIVSGIDVEAAQWWTKIFFAGAGEWIIERPLIKIATRKP